MSRPTTKRDLNAFFEENYRSFKDCSSARELLLKCYRSIANGTLFGCNFCKHQEFKVSEGGLDNSFKSHLINCREFLVLKENNQVLSFLGSLVPARKLVMPGGAQGPNPIIISANRLTAEVKREHSPSPPPPSSLPPPSSTSRPTIDEHHILHFSPTTKLYIDKRTKKAVVASERPLDGGHYEEISGMTELRISTAFQPIALKRCQPGTSRAEPELQQPPIKRKAVSGEGASSSSSTVAVQTIETRPILPELQAADFIQIQEKVNNNEPVHLAECRHFFSVQNGIGILFAICKLCIEKNFAISTAAGSSNVKAIMLRHLKTQSHKEKFAEFKQSERKFPLLTNEITFRKYHDIVQKYGTRGGPKPRIFPFIPPRARMAN